MSRKPNGGPAFPPGTTSDSRPTGMSLRDWFAGQALIAYLGGTSSSAESAEAAMIVMEKRGESIHQFIASGAYAFADAMLAERSK